MYFPARCNKYAVGFLLPLLILCSCPALAIQGKIVDESDGRPVSDIGVTLNRPLGGPDSITVFL